MMDPSHWPRDEVAQLLERTRTGVDTSVQKGESSGSMVVGSTGPFAQYAGRKAIEAGGNAVDAAIVVATTQVTLAAGCWVSFAGIATMVVYDPATRQTHSINGPYRTFANETDATTIPTAPTPSGRTALVPGFFAAVFAAHERFGKLSWADVLAPAIWLAENGIPVGDILLGGMTLRRAQLGRVKETREFFFPEGDDPWKAGGWFRQPALARTLRKLAELGPDHVYKGEWAEAFAAQVCADGGKVTRDDLATYAPIWSRPLRGNVFGHELHTVAAPDFGGAALLEGLKLLERLEVGDPTRSPEALYWLVQVLLQTSGNTWIPPEQRVGDEHIERFARAMRARGAAERPSKIVDGSHSDYVVVVDAGGMAVAMCHSINTPMWGTTCITVGGIPIPDSACFQQQQLAQVKPGSYLPNPMNPSIAFKDGEPVLAFSSIGIGLVSTTLQLVHAMLGLGYSLPEAADLPRLHGSDMRSGDSVTSGSADSKGRAKDLALSLAEIVARLQREQGDPRDLGLRFAQALPLCIENGFATEVIAGAQAKGAKLVAMPVEDRAISRGYWGAISRDPRTGTLQGARTPGASGLVQPC